MTTTGWIKYYRRSFQNEIYFSEPFDKWHAWTDVLLMADKDTGCLMVRANDLADRWKWSRGKVLRFLSELAENGMVTLDSTIRGANGGTFLTVVKWCFFQGEQTFDDTFDGTLNGTIPWGQGGINNNINNTLKGDAENNTISSNEPKRKPPMDAVYSEEFKEIWKLYPKKQGKENAERDYIKARKEGIEKQTILDGLNAYLSYIDRNGTESRYIKNGSTWFHQRCWDDDYTVTERRTEHPKTTFHNMEERSTSYSGLFKSNYE